jgi:hypothetical protein
MLFAPNCPQQNPVEDVGLHGKHVLRIFGTDSGLSPLLNGYLSSL